jgi:hypothetical protein
MTVRRLLMVAATSAGWQQGLMPAPADWLVTYGDNLFVAVSLAGIATSSDGLTWTLQVAEPAQAWCSVAYGNGVYVAVATSTKKTAVSNDAITWTQYDISMTDPANGLDPATFGFAKPKTSFRSICFGNGMFMAVR